MTNRRQVHGIFIHGVGTQEAGYSNKAQKLLAASLSKQGADFYGQEVLWAPVLDDVEGKMLGEVGRRGSSNRPLQHLVVETLADALCYRNKQEPIFDLIDSAFIRTRADEVHIFAHSLGVLLSVEWMRSRQLAKVERLHSFGCNLQLFHLGGPFVVPQQIDRKSAWVNYFDGQDMLGWPVSGWVPGVKDTKVNVGAWWQRWNGLAHIGYFEDTKFWRDIVPTGV